MTVPQHSRLACSCEAPNWRYGGSSKQPHPLCENPNQLVCLGCDAVVQMRCGRSSRTMCVPCSETYRRRVRRIFLSGWSDNPAERLGLLTLTAPGAREHSLPDGSTCPCTPAQGVHLPSWNASAGKGFNRFIQDLRRSFGDIEYCRAAEVQKRGALHFHVLFRASSSSSARRLWAKPGKSIDSPLRRLAMKHGFGHEVDLQVVRSEGAASYCAKYVSKSSADRDQLPWLDLRTGELGTGAPRYRPWSSSRSWSSLTMKAIKAEQAAWVRAQLSIGGPPAGGEERAAEDGSTGAAGSTTRATAALDPRTANYTSGVYDRPPPGLICPQPPASGWKLLRLGATDRQRKELEQGAGAWSSDQVQPGCARLGLDGDRGAAALTDSGTHGNAFHGEAR